MIALTLDPGRFVDFSLPLGTSWLLGDCMEARGQQELWLSVRPERLETLRLQAMIESVESSNRIEGVTVAPARLEPLVLGGAAPRDRSEEEIAGYRLALDWLFAQDPEPSMDASRIRELHRLAQGGTVGDAGDFKKRDNEIIEILPTGERRLRFVPTSAVETPAAVEQLCHAYGLFLEQSTLPPVLTVATFVFDFLSIHPFRDGNGRVSRLLTNLLLLQQGFKVSRYLSLERLVEQRRDDYYRVLAECSAGWREGQNTILPWWNFFLEILRRAYRDLAERVEATDAPELATTKTTLVEQTILTQRDPFTLAHLQAQLPGVSDQLIRKVLTLLKAQGRIQLEGRGRGAAWKVLQENPRKLR